MLADLFFLFFLLKKIKLQLLRLHTFFNDGKLSK